MSSTSLKRLAIGLFLLALTVANSNWRTAAEGPKINPNQQSFSDEQARMAASRGDCSFLNNPKILGDAREHARELSDATVQATASMPTIATNDGKIKHNNYIDDEIFGKMDQDGVTPAPLSSDYEFIRRVTLDLTGRIPTPDQVNQFVNDTSPDKRNRLIDSLIGTPAFVDRWTMFLGDLVKNNAFSTNIVRYPQGRNAFYNMIKQSVQQNQPYNQFASALITSNGNSFQKGEVNYIIGAFTPMGPPQDTYDTALVQTSTRFLGIDTFDCLLCHDGAGHTNALNVWATNTKRVQAWGMSAFFSQLGTNANVISKKPVIISRDIFDRGNGAYLLNTDSGNRTPRAPVNGQTVITPSYLFTAEKPAQGESYRAALARLMTSDRQFARAAVNYLWAHFFSLGIVDPPTGFDLMRLDPKNPPPDPFTIQPTHPALLEKLADDFIANNYDLQHMMKVITQSNAYQLSSRYNGDWKPEYTTYFARKLVRRLDAEELHDALSQSTNIFGNYNIFGFNSPVQYAMQLPDTTEPIFYNYGGGNMYSAEAVAARNFLDTFGRGNRDQVPRSNSPSILQGLTLMNSAFVNNRIRASLSNSTLSRLLAADSSDQKLVQDLFLNVLSRQPSKPEMDQALPLLKSDRNQGAEDLLWVLLNKIDFLYNY